MIWHAQKLREEQIWTANWELENVLMSDTKQLLLSVLSGVFKDDGEILNLEHE